VAQGRFITFEGGEGAGKSTQIRRLAARLADSGAEVVVTREPGGSPGAETIRELLVNGDADRWSPTTEALLMYAARRDHLERTVRPALERGATVLSDRFADSTRAYQGAGGKLSAEAIAQLERFALEPSDWPVLTLILDLPVAEGLKRAGARGGGEARFESKGLEFHERLRAGFLAIAEREPERCAVIDATGDIDAVAAAIWSAVSTRLGPA
jgi:dTMP kinase